ncbi:flagellar filament capping protein FliD [Bacillus shivajii]|uniref:flagellar filament capping protein FliD n=1 Tax=Bacillus shivajii TaxID=1983719 RepID=UPI001CF9DA21|nr:flagellar filament capping protein FliD [Bacillus shivajii]UCZ52683.1 flagellar filament capping protein FliD [Bacillus shivajii]
MRLSGFATGMDINQMVQDLMRAERMPMDRMQQDQQLLEWRMEEFRAMNLKLDQFRTNIFDTILRRSNMTANTATSSNEQLVTATATSSANPGTLRISEVKNLATAASNASTNQISGDEKIDTSKPMHTQSFANDFWDTGIIHQEEKTVESQTDLLTLDHEGNIHNANLTQVTVNGVAIEVVTDEANLNEHNVLVNEDGTLQFGKELRSNDKVDVKFFTENAEEQFEIDPDNLSLKLDKSFIDIASLSVEGNEGPYEVVTELDSGTELSANQVFVNLETGELRFAEGTTDSIDVTYSQQYSSSSIKVYNEDGDPVVENFLITPDQSMDDVIKKMNDSSLEINVYYDEFSDKLSVIRTETGQFNEDGPEITFSGGLFTEGFHLQNENERGGQNASFTVNGLETERRSNTFSINGVTMTLQGTFAEGEDSVTIGASTDVESIMETITGFIDEYNELVDFANEKLREERHRDYHPLTDDQRDAMTEREIERWEERAMSGMLRNDRTIRSGFNTFRNDMYAPVNIGLESEINHLSQIGITTTNNFRDGGKLEIDEDKLRGAIENDAEAVFQLFAGDGDTHADKGLARRVRESANGLIDQISQQAGGMRGRNLNHQFTIGREMDRIDDRVSNFERRMQQVEQRYWSQFTAMEKAVAQANSQAESLFAQLYGGF